MHIDQNAPVLWVTLHDTGWTINNFVKLWNTSFWIKKAGLSCYCQVNYPQCSMHFAQLWMCMHLDARMFKCKKCMCGEWVWVTVWGMKQLSGECECGGTHLLGSTRPLSSRGHVHWSSFSMTGSSSLHDWWNEAPSGTLPIPPASAAP